jgi:hypothetical protein
VSDGLFTAVTGKRANFAVEDQQNKRKGTTHPLNKPVSVASSTCVRVASAQYVFAHSSSSSVLLEENSHSVHDGNSKLGMPSNQNRVGLQRSHSTSRFVTSSASESHDSRSQSKSESVLRPATGLFKQLSTRNSSSLQRSTSVALASR